MEEDKQVQSQAGEKTETKKLSTNTLIIIVVVIVILGAAGYFLYSRQKGYQAPTTTTPPQTQTPQTTEETVTSEGREIVVEGDEFSFSPSSISLKKGEKIKLTFNNVGSFPHNLTVEELGIATKTIGSGETDSIEFTAEDGTYTIFCSVGNHRAQGLEGELEVE